MPTATAKSRSVYYESHGNGPVIVLVHGAGGNHAIWWQQVAYFRNAYQVITIDLHGFGRSSRVAEGSDALEFPEDIRAVLEHANVTGAAVLGQSIGAVAAMRVALAYPDRVKAVIPTNSVGGINHPALNPLVKADRAKAEELPVIDRLLTKAFQQNQAAKTFLFNQIGTFNDAKMWEIKNLGVPGPTPDDIKAAGVQVCFIAGEVDSVLSPPTARMANQLVEGSTLEVVPGAPHSMYWEAPEIFNPALERALKLIHGA